MTPSPSAGVEPAGIVRGDAAQLLGTGLESPGNASALWPLVQDPQIDRVCRSAVYDCVGDLVAQISPRPVTVVLTGSFARGEGSVLRIASSLKVLGDMEFMVFFEPAADLDHLQTLLAENAERLERRLANCGLDCKLEFSAVSLQYARNLQPHIFAYELLRHGRTIWGRDVLGSARRFEASAIPKWDAWRMLNNRLIEQLEWTDVLQHGDCDQLHEVFYQVLKCCLDVATTLLIFGGRYRDTYAERASELQAWASNPSAGKFPGFLPLVAERVAASTEFKLMPDTRHELLGVRLDEPDVNRLRQAVTAAVLDLVPLVHQVWRWETAQLSGSDLDPSTEDNQLRDAVLKGQPWCEKVRGWAKLALMPAARKERGFVSRIAVLLRRGSPRYLLYCVSSALYFSLPQLMTGQRTELHSFERLLPVRFNRYSHKPQVWWRLRGSVLSGWHLFLRNHWA